MAITTTLAACSTNPSLNGPDGSDLPSVLDNAVRYALSFIAELRDGAALTIGMMAQFPTTTAPAGWLKLNGALVSRTTYANLFAFATSAGLVSEAAWTAGSTGCFSVGDGASTFRLPDARGVFFRGLDESRGIDTGRVLGVYQDHANAQHLHAVSDPTHTHAVNDPSHNHGGVTGAAGLHSHTYQNWNSTGAGATTGGTVVYAPGSGLTGDSGLHGHSIPSTLTGITLAAAVTGITVQNQGGSDGRPRNLAYPMFIKY